MRDGWEGWGNGEGRRDTEGEILLVQFPRCCIAVTATLGGTLLFLGDSISSLTSRLLLGREQMTPKLSYYGAGAWPRLVPLYTALSRRVPSGKCEVPPLYTALSLRVMSLSRPELHA